MATTKANIADMKTTITETIFDAVQAARTVELRGVSAEEFGSMMLRKNHAQLELIELAKRGVVGGWETAYQIQALWVAQFELTRSYC